MESGYAMEHHCLFPLALEGLVQGAAVFFSNVTFATLQTDYHATQQEEEVFDWPAITSLTLLHSVCHQVCKGLKWLADHTPSQPPLSHVSVREFIEQGIIMLSSHEYS